MSAAGRELWKALDKPEEWDVDHYAITHNPSKQSFWIANGSFFFDGNHLRGTPKCLGLLERHWLHWKARQIARKVATERVARRFKEAS